MAAPSTYEIPSVDDITEFYIAAHKAKDSGANYAKKGPLWKWARAKGLSMADLHYHIRQVQLDLAPWSTKGELLNRWLSALGIPRRGAVGGAKDAALRVTGEVGATVPSDQQLTHTASGLAFKNTSGGTIPAGGFLDVNVSAIDTGEQTNLQVTNPRQELQWDSTPTDLDDVATIVLALENGRDAETEDAAIKRLLNKLAEGSAGGNKNDWAQWVLKAADYVDTSYIYRHRQGLGTVDVAALKSGSGAARLLDATERAEVLAYLDGDDVRPFTSVARVLEVVQTAVNVEALIKASAGYLWDWDDSTPPTFSSYDSATRKVTFGADRPSDMAKLDRLFFDLDGTEYQIESLSGSDAVILSNDLATVPAGGTECYSGSAFTKAARAAVLALFDSLGPANPDDKLYGSWEGNLRTNQLRSVIDAVAGVLDVLLVTPSANVNATDYPYPSDSQIEQLIAGWVVVRRDWT